MRSVTAGVLAVLLLLPCATRVAGQRHAASDRAIAGSLLTSFPLPLSGAPRWTDTTRLRPTVRAELQYSVYALGEVAASRTVFGLRREWVERDGHEGGGWSGGVVGARVALVPWANGGLRPSAIELHLGGRTLDYLERPAWPDLGVELLVGIAGLDIGDAAFNVGIRAPAEWVVPAGPGRLLVALTPTIAWGNFHLDGCVDDGPGDNCGDMGIQIEPGRTRFVLGGGLGYTVDPTGLTLSLGLQRLLAVGQQPRVGVGVTWAY